MHLPTFRVNTCRSSSHTRRSFGSFGHFIFIRCASTASAGNSSEDPLTQELPFPKHPHPTPHEIFHLKPGAHASEIKARYYQLVRIHHPDAPHARRLPSHVSHARFQAIQAAHDVLRGKMNRSALPSGMHATASRGHTAYHHRRPHYHYAEWAQAAEEAEEHANDRKNDQMIVLGAIAAIGLVAIPFLSSAVGADSKHKTAVQNLAQARRDAQEFGMIRRREIRKHVRSQELDREYEEKAVSNEDDGRNRLFER